MEFLRRVWQVEDGLPHPLVRAVMQSRDGGLWLGLDESLVRFDGVRFVEYERKDYAQKNERWMVALTEGNDGSIWTSGCNGGIVRLHEGKITHYTTNNGLPDNYVLSACVDKKGTVWVGTAKGLAQMRGDKFVSITNEPGLIVEATRSIVEDRNGNLWIGTAKGLSRLKDGQFTSFTTNNLLAVNAIMTIYESKDGSLWLGTSEGLSHIRDEKLLGHYRTKDGLAHGTVRTLYEDSNGALWVGSHGGLQRFVNGTFLPVKLGDVTADSSDSISDIIYSVCEDHEGNLWAGSSAGLNRLKPQQFKTYTRENGLGHNQVTCVFQDRSNAVWVGTFGGGLTRFSDGKATRFTTDDGLSSNHILALGEDRKGTLWIGTDLAGIVKFKDDQFTKFNLGGDQAANTIRVIYCDRQNRLWIAKTLEVCRFERGEKGEKGHFVVDPDVNMANVKAITEDADGRLWLGSKGEGLMRWDGRNKKIYTTRDGLSTDWVSTLYADKDGAVWVGSEAGGFNRYKDGKISHFVTDEGVFNERVLHIQEDNNGKLWMGTRNGIFSANKKELDDFAEGKTAQVNFTHYGKADGLRRVQCSSIGQPAGLLSREGQLWFPTVYGAVVFNPAAVTANRVPPPVEIEQVLVEGKSLPDWRSGKFPPGNGHLEFQFTAFSFYAPEKVRFKYKLEGFDAEWQDGSTRRSARYTNLRPGDYTFRVKACNNDGVWNEKGAAFHFTLAPHFYETFFFYGLCVLAAIAAGAGVWRLRIQQLKHREKELVVQVNERTKALQQEINERKLAEEKLQDLTSRLERSNRELQDFASVAAHDLQEPLRKVNVFGDRLKTKCGAALSPEGADYLDRMQKATSRMQALIDGLLTYSRVTTKAQPFEKVDLAKVAQEVVSDLETRIEQVGGRVEVGPLPVIDAEPLQMRQLLQNLVGNALKFNRPGEKPVVKIESTLLQEPNPGGSNGSSTREMIQITVSDNGVGFDEKYSDRLFQVFQRLHSRTEYEGTGVGLAITRKIAERHGGRISAKSKLGVGSTFTIVIPTKQTKAEASVTS